MGMSYPGPAARHRPYHPYVPVLYPKPTSAAATAVMRANRKADTRPELALRSAMHRRGMRFRVRLPIVAGGLRVVPDIVFTRAKVAAFIDGCYWHSCPDHGVSPSSNAVYWLSKLAGNVERDRRVDAALAADGWKVVRIWEHEVTAGADVCASAVAETVR